jgi:acetoin utilization deacetylase AcuC-like enzyme
MIEGLAAGGCAPDSFTLPTIAAPSAVTGVHDPAYVALIERFCEGLPEHAAAELPTGDTTVGHDSYRIALLAAGAAVDAVVRARADRPMLALVRPPGHHAEPARGMGFCLLNNVAIAGPAARRDRGATLIVDFDYHHGNGTQAWAEHAVRDGGAPLGFISTHASPAYPGTGAFDESHCTSDGFVIDVPLDLDTTTDDFVGVWASLLPPLAQALRPSTIVVSAGFEFLDGDTIAGLPVTVDAVEALCGLLGEAAADHNASLALVLEGGYNLLNLRESGELLARSFGNAASRVHVPAGHQPANRHLREMTSTILGWL